MKLKLTKITIANHTIISYLRTTCSARYDKIVTDPFHLYLGASLTLQHKNLNYLVIMTVHCFSVLGYMFCRIQFGKISEHFLRCSFAETVYIHETGMH